MSGYSRVQLFVNDFPGNEINHIFDGGAVFGTDSCCFSHSITHLCDSLCWVDLRIEPVVELCYFETPICAYICRLRAS